MGQKEPAPFFASNEEVFNLATFGFTVHAFCFWPILRSGQGRRGMGWHGLCAALLIPMWAGFVESEPLLLYWYLWFAFVAYRRLESFVRRWRGERVHSWYVGYPWLTGIIFRSEGAAIFAEPFLCLSLGFLLQGVDEGLGFFVSCGALSLGALALIGRERRITIETAITDGEIESEQYFESRRNRR